MSLLPAVDAPTGLSPGDHLCWTYADEGDLAADLVAFLDEGRQRDEQLLLVGPRSAEELLDSVAGLPDRDAMVESGQLVVRRTDETYRVGQDLDAVGQVEVLRSCTEAALASGRTGLRIAADVTDMGRHPRSLRAMQQYELEVDALFEQLPVTAMCIYSEHLGDAVLSSLSVLHPLQHRTGRDPLLHVAVRDDVVRLHGELDLVVAGEVSRVLADVCAASGTDVTVDLAELAFLDVAGARALADAASDCAARGHELRLVGASPSATRCLELFGIPSQRGQR